MKYTSNAEWTITKKSMDTHNSKEFAQEICDSLLREYGFGKPPCETRGNCLKAWVEEKEGEK